MDCVKKWKIKIQDVYISPPEVFDEIEKEFGLDLRGGFDPCPYPCAEEDGLTIDWKSPAFCNPPFSKSYDWIVKAKEQAEKGVTTIMVLPWYAWYGFSKCKTVVPYPPPKRRTFKFFNPITGQYAKLTNGVMFLKISPA